MLFQKRASIEAAPLQDEALLFHPEDNHFFVLNGTAAFVWEQLPVPSSVEEIAERLCRSYGGVARDEALRDVRGVLDEMVALSIVETAERSGRDDRDSPALTPSQQPGTGEAVRTYEPPRVQAMSQEEVLSSFQLTQAGITWWTM
jgi:hypothetical protein